MIYLRTSGGLANRLWVFAHAVAFSLDTGVSVMNPSFARHASAFQLFAGDRFCRFPPRRGGWIPRLLVAGLSEKLPPGVMWVHAAPGQRFDLGSHAFRQRASRRVLIVVEGWEVRDFDAWCRHRTALRRVFLPVGPVLDAAARLVAAARRRRGVVVGVHRRRGDYATAAGGRWLYDDAVYDRVMRETAAQLGGNAAFLLCSDEPWRRSSFSPDIELHGGAGSAPLDLAALSMCDLIVGPPSTFSAWASFMGEVPRGVLEDASQRLAVPDFRVEDDGLVFPPAAWGPSRPRAA